MHGSEINFKVNPATFLVWTVLIITDQTQFLFCSFVSALLHESAHIASYISFHASVLSIEVLPFGISASIGKSSELSCTAEIISSLSGPLMNLGLAFFFMLLPESFIYGSEYFIYCNFAFFVVNILPVIPLDGGRILYFSLLRKYKFEAVSITVKVISIFVSLIILLSGIYILFVTGLNMSVLLIGVYLLIYIFTSYGSF